MKNKKMSAATNKPQQTPPVNKNLGTKQTQPPTSSADTAVKPKNIK